MQHPLFSKSIDFIGRLFLAIVFVIALPVKITKFSSVAGAIVDRGIPEPLASILLVAAIICIVIGTVLLVFSPNQKIGASLLLVFLIPTTIIFHVFPFQFKAFFMNLGLIGGLILSISRPTLDHAD